MRGKRKNRGMRILKHGIIYTLMILGVIFMLLIAVVVGALQFSPESHIARWVQTAVVQDSTTFAPLTTDVSIVFRATLLNEVQEQLGKPPEGYEPHMFLAVFPGLTETDFEGVEASVGYYTIDNGVLKHIPDPSRLVHSAAKSVSRRGMDTLLMNISKRLKIDLSHDGTLTIIMNALTRSGM
jgi:hypothetical protein